MARGTMMRAVAAVPIVGLLGASVALAGDQPVESPALGETMHVERVEPGVLRVLHDRAGHDLTDWDTFEDPKPVSLLAAGDDGSVWMTSSGGFIEIGVPGEVADPMDTFLAQMEIGADGTLWIANGHDGTEIGRWRDEAWTIFELPADAWVVWLDATADGGLDFAWRDESTLHFGRLSAAAEDWEPASAPPPLPLISPDGYVSVERTPDGQLWAAEGPFWQRGQRFGPGPVWRFDGRTWRRLEPLGDLPVQPGVLIAERSGAVRVSWWKLVRRSRHIEPAGQTRHTADGSWELVPAPTDAKRGGGRARCRGYVSYDGVEPTRYLDGLCLRPAAVTPTGDVWVFGHDHRRRNPGVYVITPATRTIEMPEAGIAVTFPATWRLWSRPGSDADESTVVASDLSRRWQCTVSLMPDATSAELAAQETYDAIAAHRDLEGVALEVFAVPAGQAASVSYRVATAPEEPRAVRYEHYVSVPGGVVSVFCGGEADPPADGWRHILDGLALLPLEDGATAPFDPRVVVPESGFAVAFPAEWLVRPWVAPGPLLGGRSSWRAITLGAGPTDGYECIAEDASALPQLTDVAGLDDWRAALADAAEARGYAEPVVVPSQLELLSGPVPRADWDDLLGMPASAWLFSDADRHVALLCRSGEPPEDRWLSIAETFEFLSADR